MYPKIGVIKVKTCDYQHYRMYINQGLKTGWDGGGGSKLQRWQSAMSHLRLVKLAVKELIMLMSDCLIFLTS